MKYGYKVKQLPSRMSSNALKRADWQAAGRRTAAPRHTCANPSATWRPDSVLSIQCKASARARFLMQFIVFVTVESSVRSMDARVVTPVVARTARTLGYVPWFSRAFVTHQQQHGILRHRRISPTGACLMYLCVLVSVC